MDQFNKYICIHGHFYQPPRENPWLNQIEVQDSAYPFHDWNERISHECYGPNAKARILEDKGRLTELLNNYRFISFNFGPTLLSWLEKSEKSVYEQIIQADIDSYKARDGHGNAIAQAFNHIIMPLASRRDKITQVIWGINDFKLRFSREPEGMWLPETAVDTETLEILIDNGIKYTILAQKQALKFRNLSTEPWIETNSDAIDPSRPYLCRLSQNRSITLFFYDGPISQSIAFEGLLHSGEAFKNRLMSAFSPERNWNQLVNIATDGESYGHHHRFGEMALAYAINAINTDPEVKLTNYGEYLALNPPEAEAQFHENSAWSCAHGVGRWSTDCGCCIAPKPNWNQKWRAPLREGLNLVRDRVDKIFESQLKDLIKDPWASRDQYINLIINENHKNSVFLKRHELKPLRKGAKELVLKMLEMQRNRMYMFTSCGWFFDDIAGLEALQILRYAAAALQIAQLFDPLLTKEFLSILSLARSNENPGLSGADLFTQKIIPQVADLGKVAAHIAIASLFEDLPIRYKFYCYNVNLIEHEKERSGEKTLMIGRTLIANSITTESESLNFAVIHHGGVDLRCSISNSDTQEYELLRTDLIETFRKQSSTELIRKMDDYFPEKYYSLADLFVDERRKVIETITHKMYEEQEWILEEFYRNNKDIAVLIKSNEAKLPVTFLAAAVLVIERTILSELEKLASGYYPDELQSVLEEAAYWDIHPELSSASKLISRSISWLIKQLGRNPSNYQKAHEIINLLKLSKRLNSEADLVESQILFFEIVQRLKQKKIIVFPTGFKELAELLLVDLNNSPA